MSSFKEERNNIFSQLDLTLEKVLKETNEYLTTFKKEDFFEFSHKSEKGGYYKKKYYSFVLKISEAITSLEAIASDISSLLIEADRNMDVESVNSLNFVFCSYQKLQTELSRYTAIAEKELSRDSASASVLLEATKRLRAAIIEFTANVKKQKAEF